MNYTIKASALSRRHLGALVQISRDDLRITDTLRSISHEADLVEERKVFEEVPRFTLGHCKTILTFARAGSVRVNGESDVLVEELR